jgi:hypothetical protein
MQRVIGFNIAEAREGETGSERARERLLASACPEVIEV